MSEQWHFRFWMPSHRHPLPRAVTTATNRSRSSGDHSIVVPVSGVRVRRGPDERPTPAALPVTLNQLPAVQGNRFGGDRRQKTGSKRATTSSGHNEFGLRERCTRGPDARMRAKSSARGHAALA
jgi:hypothetical protein